MLVRLIINLILVSLLNQTDVSRLPFSPGENGSSPLKISEESLGIKTTAKAVLVMDVDTGAILFEKNKEEKLPVASLTKLAAALVFLEQDLDWDKITKIELQDDRPGGKLYVYQGETLRVRDLFYSALVGSANNATITLARESAVTLEEFVQKMNEKTKSLGLISTYFTEPSGLDPANKSTVYEIALLAHEAFKKKEIQEAVLTPEYFFKTINTKNPHTIKNTNDLLNSFLNETPFKITGSKTGYLDEVGYCLVVEAQNEMGRKIIVVVLGSESSEARFQEAKGLLAWTFENFKWEEEL